MELCLTRGAVDFDIAVFLARCESDELQGDDVRSLVEELVEGMLSVGTRFAEHHGSGGIGYRLAEPVH